MDKNVKIGDLVKSTYHVGIGIILNVLSPEQKVPIDYRYEHEPMVMIYWFFPDPIEGTEGWENGIDYEYVARIYLVDK